MLSRGARARIAKLAPHEGMTVRIVLPLCPTQADYQLAFEKAWAEVPVGATVYCWLRDLSDREYLDMVLGLVIPPTHQGIYLKTRQRIEQPVLPSEISTS